MCVMEMEASLVLNQSSFNFFVKWQELKSWEIQKTSSKMGPNALSKLKEKTIIETNGSFWNQKIGQY